MLNNLTVKSFIRYLASQPNELTAQPPSADHHEVPAISVCSITYRRVCVGLNEGLCSKSYSPN